MGQEEECCSKKDQAEVDIYRDTPVRLLGYANEVGEAFRALVHVKWVQLSYGVASCYVVRLQFIYVAHIYLKVHSLWRFSS